MTCVSLSGCIIELSPLEEDGTGGTGGATDQQDACVLGNTICNGVELFCKNHNDTGGADDTGGDAPNFWWRRYDPLQDGILPPETVIPPCSSAGSDDTHCLLPNAVLGSPNCCLIQQYHDPDSNHHAPSVPICVGSSFPAPIDPLGPEWEFGYPSIQPEIRTTCSGKCENNNWPGYGQAPAVCEDDQWSGFETRTSWDPQDGFSCLAPVGFHQNDPHGANVPWHLVGGSTAPAPLSSALGDDCADWFYPHVAAFVNTPGRADFIDPETRNASYLAIEEAGSVRPDRKRQPRRRPRPPPSSCWPGSVRTSPAPSLDTSSRARRLSRSARRFAKTRLRTYRSTPPSATAETQSQTDIHITGEPGDATMAVSPITPSTNPTLFVRRLDGLQPIPRRGPFQNRQLGNKPRNWGCDISPPPQLRSAMRDSSSEDVATEVRAVRVETDALRCHDTGGTPQARSSTTRRSTCDDDQAAREPSLLSLLHGGQRVVARKLASKRGELSLAEIGTGVRARSSRRHGIGARLPAGGQQEASAQLNGAIGVVHDGHPGEQVVSVIVGLQNAVRAPSCVDIVDADGGDIEIIPAVEFLRMRSSRDRMNGDRCSYRQNQ